MTEPVIQPQFVSPSYVAVAVILDEKARRLEEFALESLENKHWERARDARIKAMVLRESALEFREIEANLTRREQGVGD
jgi:hypothetical protein